MTPADERFDRIWASVAGIGRDPRSGGYRRFAWTPVDLELREWFADQAERRGMAYHQDRNGNQWAWWGAPAAGAVVTGSHLDSVPDGGAYDGPLGVVSGFLAIDELRQRDVRPVRPIAVVNRTDEEGARFDVACLGSRLLTGVLAPELARGLRDGDGVTLAEAMRRAGADPAAIGRDDEALARIGTFVELHVEQGRGLVDLDAPVGVATAIWPHGRWRCSFRGEANHAGTTRLADRRDTRAADDATVAKVVAEIAAAAEHVAARHGVDVEVASESYAPVVEFGDALRDRIAAVLGGVPALPTGAGHDAGVLSARVPSAMLFVRNPTGVSHSPSEYAEAADCVAGVHALAAVLEELSCR